MNGCCFCSVRMDLLKSLTFHALNLWTNGEFNLFLWRATFIWHISASWPVFRPKTTARTLHHRTQPTGRIDDFCAATVLITLRFAAAISISLSPCSFLMVNHRFHETYHNWIYNRGIDKLFFGIVQFAFDFGTVKRNLCGHLWNSSTEISSGINDHTSPSQSDCFSDKSESGWTNLLCIWSPWNEGDNYASKQKSATVNILSTDFK